MDDQTREEDTVAELTDDEIAANELASKIAAARCHFALTYTRTQPRQFHAEGIDGPPIDDAFRPGQSSPGEWIGGETIWHRRHTVDGWVDVYAGWAVHEAVHEALEWMQVDGQPWLNPHGVHEDTIQALVDELVGKLTALRKEQ